MDTFGEWLRGQRSAHKLTREEFADRVGCSVSALRKIDNGERRLSVQIAELMANCLVVPLEERSTFPLLLNFIFRERDKKYGALKTV